MATEINPSDVAGMLERVDNEKYERVLGELDVHAGETNVIGLVELGIGLEAIGDNILVLIDTYRSGYECSMCRGTGKLKRKARCVCDPDVPDAELNFPRGSRNRFDAPCGFCGGDYVSKRIDDVVTCSLCKGKGSSLIIPDTAKSLPTTGVILSVGPDVTRGGIAVNKRVICTAHSGVGIPMKGNIPVKVYRQHEPLCVLYNIKKDGTANKDEPGELATNQFVDLDDVPLGQNFSA
jgi:hypothetical protein